MNPIISKDLKLCSLIDIFLSMALFQNIRIDLQPFSISFSHFQLFFQMDQATKNPILK